MRSFVLPRLVLAVLVVALSSVLGVRPGTVSACSCAIGDPVVAIDGADVVFTGTLIDKVAVGPDSGDHYDWTFEVDGVVKGEVTSPQFVTGEEFGFGCGTNYQWLPGSITVYARRDGERVASIGCSPTLSAADLQVALDQAAGESGAVGSGSPSALAVGPAVDANLFVLGSDGLPLARWRLPLEPNAVAHCAGTTRAAMWSSGPSIEQDDGYSIAGTVNVVSIVELETMEVVATREIESEFVSIRDQLECFDGGGLVILSRGDGSDGGRVTVATSVADGGGVSRIYENITRAVIHPAGTVALLPTRPGEPIRTVAGAGLQGVGQAGGAELGDRIAVVGGAFSPGGDRFAALVTSSGTEVQFDTDATGVLLLDVTDGVVQAAQNEPVAVPSHDGRARQIAWLDDEHLLIEHETDDSKIFAVVTTEGEVVDSENVGWGWGLTRIDGSILRSRDGGMELIDVDMRSTPLVPSPSEQFEDGWFFTASIVEAPEMTLPPFAWSGLTIRPFEQLPDDSPTVEPVAETVADGESTMAVDADSEATASVAASEPGEDRGLQVAGLAFVAFVVVGTFMLLRRPRTGQTRATP